MKIVLKPIGNIGDDVPEALKESLNQTFGCPIETTTAICDFDQAYDAKRDQYLASTWLATLNASGEAKDEKVLGISDVDLYTPGLNFVFGQANTTSGIAIISLYRLRQEYYGLSPDRDLFLNRATKEAVHELGHTFGLEHCPNTKCVMHFSNTLADTDFKQGAFCSQCRPKLIK